MRQLTTNINDTAEVVKHSHYHRSINILLVLISFLPAMLSGQDTGDYKKDTSCVRQKLGDVISVALNKPPKVKPEKAGSLLLLQKIGSFEQTKF